MRMRVWLYFLCTIFLAFSEWPLPAYPRAGFEVPGPSNRRCGLIVSEIHYHPSPQTDGRQLEFVELYNSNPFPEDIAEFRLGGSISYSFPKATKIPAQS